MEVATRLEINISLLLEEYYLNIDIKMCYNNYLNIDIKIYYNDYLNTNIKKDSVEIYFYFRFFLNRVIC